MKKIKSRFFISFSLAILFVCIFSSCGHKQSEEKQARTAPWSVEQAHEWSEKWGWLRGSNFQPSSAINQLEMFQAETFDTETIDRELGWAEELGMNCMRVYLHHLAWQTDQEGFKSRLDKYLSISWKHGIGTMFVFFDDCWNPTYQAGIQPKPKTGVHNSGWVQDPGALIFETPEMVDSLEIYVKDVMKAFAHDDRVVAWDLYNEPGNSRWGNRSMPLLQKVFQWAWEVNPSQPVTVGVWNNSLADLNKFQLEHSDIITYHNYENLEKHTVALDSLKKYNRPMMCTEYMARTQGSRFQNIMPLLKEEHVGAMNWGFVSGKTNTIYAWNTPIPSGDEPELWFHDILRKDGSPFSEEEVSAIKKLTGKVRR